MLRSNNNKRALQKPHGGKLLNNFPQRNINKVKGFKEFWGEGIACRILISFGLLANIDFQYY